MTISKEKQVDLSELVKKFDNSDIAEQMFNQNEGIKTLFYAPSFIKEDYRTMLYAPKINKEKGFYKSHLRFIPYLQNMETSMLKFYVWSFWDQAESLYYNEASNDNFNSYRYDPVKEIINMRVPSELAEVQKEFKTKCKLNPNYICNIALENDQQLDEEYQKVNWIFHFKNIIFRKLDSYFKENDTNPFSPTKCPLFTYKITKGPATNPEKIVPTYEDSSFIESDIKAIDIEVLKNAVDLKSVINIPSIEEVEEKLEKTFSTSDKYAPLINYYLTNKSKLEATQA